MDKSKDMAINVLLAEYTAMRAELRMIFTAMDTGMRTMLLLAGGIVTVAVTIKDERVLYLFPSVILRLSRR